MYFQIAKPLGKPDFLQVYKEAVLLTQLLFAPFGLADSTVDILGEQSALELYTSVFQQFEDLVSKRIFTIRGFEDDRIIASMHAFVGESQDEEVVREMQAATAALQNMLVPPRVIEFDFQHLPQEFSVVTAHTASILLSRVLSALIPMLYGKDSELLDCEFYLGADAGKAMQQSQRTLFSIDKEMLEAENIRITTSAFSPTCCFSKAPFNSTSLRCGDSINALLVALSVPVSHLLSTDLPWLVSAHSGGNTTTTATTTECTVQFSLQQYHSLLDLYGTSEEVSAVLQHYIHQPTGPTGAPATIPSVRSSLLLSSLNLSASPTVSYVNQLSSRLTALTKAAVIAATAAAPSGTESKQPSEDEEFALIYAEDAVELAYHYIQSRTEARECEQAQQYSKARELLTEGLLDLIGKDQSQGADAEDKSERSDDESEGAASVLLPVHMRVILLTERASYTRICGDLQEALADVSRAIALDSQYAPAYSLRSKIRLQVIEEREDAEGHDDEGAGGVRAAEIKTGEVQLTTTQKADALHLAAEDALLAFLLDGSSDLALAGAAEETCREAVRLSAKSIFQDRRAATTSLANISDAPKDSLPRSWLVGSYFGAYQQLSTALSLYASDIPTPLDAVKSDVSSEVESSDNLHDIDDDTAVVALPAPPKHLLDTATSTVAATPVTVEGTAESTADGSEPSGEVSTVPQEKDKDREAYVLLLCLTELVETVTYDSKVNALSSNVPTQGLPTSAATAVVQVTPVEHITTVRQRDTVTVSTVTGHKRNHRSVAASLLAFAEEAGVQSLAQVMGGLVLDHANKSEADGDIETHRDLVFIEGGMLSEKSEEAASEATPVHAEAPVSAPAIIEDVPEVKVEPCKHYRTALSLLRGSGLGDLQSSGVVLGLPAHMLSALQNMDADTLLSLTGVRFNADGSVDHIVPAPLPAGSVATTDDQVDGDAQSESSRSERSYEYNDGEHEHDAHTGGGHGFHFDGAGMYGAFADAFGEMYDNMEEGSDEDGSYNEDEDVGSEKESHEDSEEQSDWETMSGSEATGTRDSMISEASAASEELPAPKRAAAPHKNTKAAGKTSAHGRGAHATYVKPPTGKAPSKEATKGPATTSASSAKESREAEVNAALRAVEEQMRAHHLEEFEEEVPPSPPASPTAAAARDVPVPPVAMPAQGEAQVLPPPPPVVPRTAEAEGVEEQIHTPDLDVFEPEVPPSPPASPSAATGKSAATAMDIPATSVVPESPAAPIDVSHCMRARLLNLCGSIAYLAGDATGAVQCFRASIQQDPALLDSQVKLGSLLVDMDEMKEAAKLLKGAHKKAPSDFVALLHLAELHTHENNFDEAVHLLRKARRLSETAVAAQSDNDGAVASLRAALLTGTTNITSATTSTSTPQVQQAEVQAFLHRTQRAQEETLANIISLLGINLFRQLPARPEVALHLLQGALATQFKDKHCPILLLCCGEVYSQAGDMVTALECFSKAHSSAPNNPLSYVNAARTYQQLNQVYTAEKHLQAALLLDPAMAMVRVDLAQNLLLSGSAAQALVILDQALALARQVSEIRDVLTARTIAAMQVSLEERGLYCSSGMRSISH